MPNRIRFSWWRPGHVRRFILALAAAAAIQLPTAAQAAWDETYFPNVSLTTQDGVSARFWDDVLKDKIVVVDFIYTECPDICGLSSARLAQVIGWLGERVGKDIFFYSISLDPETDTPERLKAYAEAFGAPKGWTFLTGSREDIDIVRYKLGERSETLSQHRSDMVIGNAATGEWRRASVMGSLVVLTEEILALDPEWSRPSPAIAEPGSDTPFLIANTLGEGLFLGACAACHTIGEGVRVGPDLSGVTLRRDPDWLKRYLMQPDRMLAQEDPVAVELDRAFPAVNMPNLQLNDTDAEDVIHYLASQTELLGQSQELAEVAHEEHHHDSSGHAGTDHAAAHGHHEHQH